MKFPFLIGYACFFFLFSSILWLHAADDALEAGFRQPPKEARPLVFWHWINGNITKDGIRKDLEDMRRVGIAGAMLVDVSAKTPPGPVRFGSAEWYDHVRYAMETAGELGLDFILSNCPGWAEAGGPWVTPEDSMKKLVWSETRVKGPQKFKALLDRPAAAPVHNMEETGNLDFYRDVAVLAVPASQDDKMFPAWSASMEIGSLAALSDSNPATGVDFAVKPKQTLQFTASYPSTTEKSSLEILFPDDLPANFSVTAAGSVEVSDDGKNFRKLREFDFTGKFKKSRPVITVSFPRTPGSQFRVSFTRINPKRLCELAWHGGIVIENLAAKSAAAGVPSVFPTAALPAEKTTPLAGVLNLTSSFSPDGTLTADIPEGDWTIYRIGYASTGAMIHPAQPEGEGLEVDKMNAAAVERHFNASLGPILKDLSPTARKALVGVEADSWEAGPQNWTKDFPAEFAKRRGYDAIPWLPVIAGSVLGSISASEAFLADFRRTCNELIAENFYGEMRRLANAHGLQFYAEPYNGLFNAFRSAGNIDILMGEFWMEGQWHDLPGLASFVHTSGRTLLLAEALTASPDSGLWANTPRIFKPIADRAFAVGVNRAMLHSYVHQPRSDLMPGFTLRYHGSLFGRLNSWWGQAAPWFDSMSRSQFLLQQGRAVADVLMLRHGDIDASVEDSYPPVPAGYLGDQIAPDDFLKTKAEGGRIVLPNGATYRILLLPELWAADVEVLGHLQGLMQAGVPVIGPPPVVGAGMKDLHDQAETWRSLVAALWSAEASVRQRVSPAEILQNERVSPDLTITGNGAALWSVRTIVKSRSNAGDFGDTIFWAHRVTENAEIYFLSNPGKKEASFTADFRVADKQPEIWDPVSGECRKVPFFGAKGGRITLPMTLGPTESEFVVFRQPLAANAAIELTKENGDPAYLGKDYEIIGNGIVFLSPGKYLVPAANGGEKSHVVAEPQTVAVSGPWTVAFHPPYGKEFTREFAALQSWSKSDDADIRYFSGTAIYGGKFLAPEDVLKKECFLDLGDVRDIATVSINGKPAGTAWTYPWRLDITKLIHPGENTVEIAVSNTWVNRLAGDEQLPPDMDYVVAEGQKRSHGMLEKFPEWMNDPDAEKKRQRHTFTTWRHYGADTPLVDSGLLGPVRITLLDKAAISSMP